MFRSEKGNGLGMCHVSKQADIFYTTCMYVYIFQCYIYMYRFNCSYGKVCRSCRSCRSGPG